MPMDDNTSLPSEDSLGDKDGNDLQVQDLVESEVKVERIVEEAVLKAAIRIKRESFSGPLPKPEHLKAYNEVCPGAAQDILNEFKANGQHVRGCEVKALDASIRKVERGQWFAVFLSLVCLILAIISVAMFEAHGVAIAFIVLTGTLVLPFLGFKPKDSKEVKEESE